jgi:hypothetical protein
MVIVVALWAFLGPRSSRETVGSSDSDSDGGMGASSNLEKQIQRQILTEENPLFGVSESFAALFKAEGTEGTQRLQNHVDDSIAIQAAWQEVEETVPVEKPEKTVRPDRGRLNWFLGFVELRTRVQAPQWWAEALLDARANRRGNVYLGDPRERPYHHAGLDNVRSPVDTSLTREQDQIVLRVGGDSVPIPDDILEKASTIDGLKISCNVSGLMGQHECYAAVHDDVGYPFYLYCIDRPLGTVRWKVRVWGTWWGATTGQHEGWVAVKEQNGRIVVFGKSSIGFYVEGFQAKDGRNVFRFSNLYVTGP